MYKYFVGIGSNINPQFNIGCILNELLEISPLIHISRIIETEPIGLLVPHKFLNLCVCIYSTTEEHALKLQFNEIETKLGRDRTDINRKDKSRVADLDVLFNLNNKANTVDKQILPTEIFLRPVLIELLHFLNINCYTDIPPIPQGVEITIDTIQLGKKPVTIYKTLEKISLK